MRSVGIPLLVALALAAAALGLAWSVEAVVLPPPARGDLAAAAALAVLQHQRGADSTLLLGRGGTLDATCMQGRFPRRGTLLRLSNGARVLDYANAHLTTQDMTDLELAGCPHVLGARVARLLENGARARSATSDGSLAVRFFTDRSTLTLYLAGRLDVPVGVAISGPRGTLRSRIRLQ